MKFEKINYKISCDVPGCINLAKYSLENKKVKSNTSLYFCEECLKQLYESIGKNLVPKSPKNILNNNIKKR